MTIMSLVTMNVMLLISLFLSICVFCFCLQKMVYVYFLFSILYTVVSLCASIAFLVQIGRGFYKTFVDEYCTQNAPSFGK